MPLPAARQACEVRPEQSNESGPTAPHTYGLPICAVAYWIAFFPDSDAELLISFSTPVDSHADCALYWASCSSWISRAFSSACSLLSSASAALIFSSICFFEVSCLIRLASSFSHCAVASFAYCCKSLCVRFISDIRSVAAFSPRRIRSAPSRNWLGLLLRASCAPAGIPPERYWARAAAPARFLRAVIRSCPATTCFAISTILADWALASPSARLYASVAVPAWRYSSSISLRTCSRDLTPGSGSGAACAVPPMPATASSAVAHSSVRADAPLRRLRSTVPMVPPRCPEPDPTPNQCRIRHRI